ncbi:MAG: hypothetical protein JWN48_4246 [Myxococcaceae bacterium]|nr:hypothetical protein [Myxococcaceae bacterium]
MPYTANSVHSATYDYAHVAAEVDAPLLVDLENSDGTVYEGAVHVYASGPLTSSNHATAVAHNARACRLEGATPAGPNFQSPTVLVDLSSFELMLQATFSAYFDPGNGRPPTEAAFNYPVVVAS